MAHGVYSIALGAVLFAIVAWPPKRPYVTVKGSDVHERIWLWRVPAYYDHVAWHVRWSLSDGLRARAYCYDPEKAAEHRAAKG